MLLDAGHDLVGLDTYLYEACTFDDHGQAVPSMRRDIRESNRTTSRDSRP